MNQRQKKQIIMNQRKSASKKIPNTKTQIPKTKTSCFVRTRTKEMVFNNEYRMMKFKILNHNS
ncbi:MAG: hypothetical protein COZ59_12010 [Bacteroidetes bacterium CG_4_8_14_3_um_filter_31_14]|nr:MAG: hypothetical protein COZ59_12010 [Bacteroidetes bacterium CG_4_8_14_3_um_filter_31_14]